MKILLFTDGSCGAKDKLGTWSCVLYAHGNKKILYGIARDTTISRMELAPIIEGLAWLKKNWGQHLNYKIDVTVYSDSEYTVQTLCGNYQAHKNLDLWAALDKIKDHFNLTGIWCERNKLPYMQFCDGLCSLLRDTLQSMHVGLFGDKEPEFFLEEKTATNETSDSG